MSKINKLFEEELKIINLGLKSFNDDLREQNVECVHVDWKPPSEAAKLLSLLDTDDIREKIQNANETAIERLLAAQPVLTGVGQAGADIPGMTKYTILHAGPPISWERMSEPLRGAVIGGLIYEGLADCEENARVLAESEDIIFDPCHHHDTVGPMAGVVTYSMPVWKIKNKAFGNMAYCTFNEGLGKVLRYGAFSGEVIKKLKWIETVLAPIIKEAVEIKGEMDLKNIISQMLQMGDEGHNRNKAGTSLVYRELAPYIVKTSFSNDEKAEALSFIDSNDHFFLNLSMPACKCSLDPLKDIRYSTIVHTMTRNGTDFGVRVCGSGDRWFTAPCEKVDGLYFPGFSEKDANADIGDSCITEAAGIGGFAMATAPAIVQFVGGNTSDAVEYTKSMYAITTAEHNAFLMPILDFRGTPIGIDLLKIIETGILPIINTGIACNRAGVGQVGAGIVHPPMKCFEDALSVLIIEVQN